MRCESANLKQVSTWTDIFVVAEPNLLVQRKHLFMSWFFHRIVGPTHSTKQLIQVPIVHGYMRSTVTKSVLMDCKTYKDDSELLTTLQSHIEVRPRLSRCPSTVQVGRGASTEEKDVLLVDLVIKPFLTTLSEPYVTPHPSSTCPHTHTRSQICQHRQEVRTMAQICE